MFIDSRMFSDPQIQSVYAQELERVTKPEYIQGLIDELKPSFEALQEELSQEYEEGVKPPWGTLRERSKILRLQLKPAQPVRGTFYRTLADGENAIHVELVNLMILPVDLLEFQIGDLHVVPDFDWVSRDTDTLILMEDKSVLTFLPDPNSSFETVRFLLPFALAEPTSEEETIGPEVLAVIRITGLSKEYVIPMLSFF